MNRHEPKTPSLPAAVVMSDIERRALDFAQREIAQYRDASNPWSMGPPLSPTASHAMVQSLLQTYDVDSRLWLLMLARLGQRDAIAVLERLIREYKSQSQHIPLPSELAAWDMKRECSGYRPRLRDQRGQPACCATSAS